MDINVCVVGRIGPDLSCDDILTYLIHTFNTATLLALVNLQGVFHAISLVATQQINIHPPLFVSLQQTRHLAKLTGDDTRLSIESKCFNEELVFATITSSCALASFFTVFVLYSMQPETRSSSRRLVGQFGHLQTATFLDVAFIVLCTVEHIAQHVSQQFSTLEAQLGNSVTNLKLHSIGVVARTRELLNNDFLLANDVEVLLNECGGSGNLRLCNDGE